jgi:hypothetical protein
MLLAHAETVPRRFAGCQRDCDTTPVRDENDG